MTRATVKAIEKDFRNAGPTGNKLHVFHRSGRWVLLKEGASRASSIHDSKAAAITKAKALFDLHKSEALVIHQPDGSIENFITV
ncbi:DUF2188 domain-containing protein [Flagellimonas algicola]|uniref:DUF2188 domain-containing protein n=1 Tax=Flagellimonas algicola TaxID=2583815 RepID=A0ABY2WS24_9FLAO|nr:DUF2188 domain-containing protein [Allomuricauda algicola]TMU57476.1 DUF2188 domain-containing protein [Allomuricauda algicola]